MVLESPKTPFEEKKQLKPSPVTCFILHFLRITLAGTFDVPRSLVCLKEQIR